MIRTHILHRDGAVECDVVPLSAPPATSTVWVDMESPSPEEIALLRERWNFHPLAVEDCVHEQKRPKFERYPTHGFLVLAALDRSTPNDPCDTVGIRVFLRPSLIVTVHGGALAAVDMVRAELARYPDQVGNTAERLLHALVDATTDELTKLLYELEERVDRLEQDAVRPSQRTVTHPFVLTRRDLLALRRIVLPTREVVRRFVDADNPEISAEGRMYFRDVLDHVELISEHTALLLDACNGALQVHATIVNDRLNKVMKYMAIVSTLMLPMTVISGAFGMNFAVIPLTQRPEGFWMAVGMMVLSAAVLLGVFRVRRWF